MIKRIRVPDMDAPIPRRKLPKRSNDGTILDCVHDPQLFASWFENDWPSWTAWLAFLAALFALPMDAAQLAIYRQCTGRSDPPSAIAREAWLICGRRAGKSFILALTAVFLGCFFDYRRYLSPGERGTIMIIAADRKQARVILRYVSALLKGVPILSGLIQREWAEGFDLDNSVSIEVATCSFRSTRGYTLVAGLLDELAFWSTETSSEPDYEVLNALRPGMATIPSSMLLCASSPYARRGVLYDAHRKHFGKDHDPVLVWQSPTRTMNPSVPQSFIDSEVERDPASAQAEYFAQFRTDIEAFISREAVEACISAGTYERGRIEGVTYSAFCDPSGGSSDSMTLAIASKQNGIATLDAIRERKPPFSPDDVVTEFATLLKSYGITKVLGDRYAGEWVKEPFKTRGITYEAAARPKSDLYRDFLPLVNSKMVDLLDHPKMLQQFVSLERRVARSGRDSIDSAPSAHEDIANAAAGALVSIGSGRWAGADLRWISNGSEEESNAEWRAEGLRQHILSFGNGRGLLR